VPPGPNRTLGFSYTSFSDDPAPSVSATATLLVRPVIKLQIEPRKARNHRAIIWTATVLGGPFPSQGITLDTQVHTEGKWTTFDETILPREGTSRLYKYTFRRTHRPTTYPFRLKDCPRPARATIRTSPAQATSSRSASIHNPIWPMH